MLSLVFSKMCAIEKQNNRILRRLKQLQEIADEDFKEVAFKVKIKLYIGKMHYQNEHYFFSGAVNISYKGS